MKMKRKANRILKFRVKIFLSFFLLFLFLISFLLIIKSSSENEKKVDFNYTTTSDIKYKVYLKENNFYEEKYLEEGKQYPAELINYVDIDFSYLLNSSKKLDYDYSYNVLGTIIGEYENTSSGKSELWKKKYNLLTKQKDKIKNSTILNKNQNIKIKYSDYSKIVNDFKSKFRLAIDAYLNVKLQIIYTAKDSELSKISKTEELEVNIPLTSSTITISKICQKDQNCPKKSELNVTKNENNNSNNTKRKGYILLAISIVLTVLALPSILKIRNGEYIKTKNRILKGYNEIIIEVEELPDFNDLEVVNVKSFDDMVDIEEEIKSPIIFYEIEKDKESWFIIISDKYVYRYVLES